MREEAEGANDLGGAIARQRLQHRLEITPRRIVLVAMEADGGPANPLHDVEDRFTLLLAHGIAENAAEQADIIPQRQVFLGFDRVAARHIPCPVMITAVPHPRAARGVSYRYSAVEGQCAGEVRVRVRGIRSRMGPTPSPGPGTPGIHRGNAASSTPLPAAA